jgi:hypothetical protein
LGLILLDWSLVLFPIVHDPIASGYVLSVNPDGTEEWCSPIILPKNWTSS